MLSATASGGACPWKTKFHHPRAWVQTYQQEVNSSLWCHLLLDQISPRAGLDQASLYSHRTPELQWLLSRVLKTTVTH